MRIDLHCHTKKCKKGDGKGRNVNRDKFISKICDANVGIVAITNHNHFDIEQYKEFQNDLFQVWPGIELDVEGENSKGHCILVCNPKEVEHFNSIVNDMIKSSVDDFKITIVELSKAIGTLDVIVICHYGRKKPSLSEEDIAQFKENLSSDIPFYCEPRNLISAGIYYANNIYTFIGSDVKNWDEYNARRVPELKLPIDSFDHFKLLIKKDKQVIDTFMNSKESKLISIKPFEDKKEQLNFNIYNDINVFFGGKGTGKTKILKALERELLNIYPNEISSYYANGKTEKYNEMISCELNNSDYDKINIFDGADVIKYYKKWHDTPTSTLKDYFEWKKSLENKTVKFGFVNATFTEDISYDNYNNLVNSMIKQSSAIKQLFEFNKSKYLSEEEINELSRILEKLKNAIYNEVKNEYCHIKSLELEKFTINKMKRLYANKKGTISRPISTGLIELYSNRMSIKNNSKQLLSIISDSSYTENDYIGELGEIDYIYLRKEYFLNPEKANTSCKKITNKTNVQKLVKLLNATEKNYLSNSINDKVAELSSFLEYNEIDSLRKIMFLKSYTIKTNKMISKTDNNHFDSYSPSNGEQAMLIISHVIHDDKKVYILDEPEMSVGHDYINDRILVRLRELSKNNKIVIISTHDANIAVRSLPFLSVYRQKGITYVGNPFLEEMVNLNDKNDILSWNQLSLDNLEGGKIAFEG